MINPKVVQLYESMLYHNKQEMVLLREALTKVKEKEDYDRCIVDADHHHKIAALHERDIAALRNLEG